MILLTVVNSGDILPHAVNKFVTWSVPIYDGGKGLLVNIAQHWGQTCGCIKRHHHNRTKLKMELTALPNMWYNTDIYITKYCVSSDCVASEVEHMRMISSDYSECIVDAGHEICPADGSVHFHSFMQSLLGFAFMVSVINTSS